MNPDLLLYGMLIAIHIFLGLKGNFLFEKNLVHRKFQRNGEISASNYEEAINKHQNNNQNEKIDESLPIKKIKLFVILAILILFVVLNNSRLEHLPHTFTDENASLLKYWTSATLLMLISYWVRVTILYTMNWGALPQVAKKAFYTYLASLNFILLVGFFAAVAEKNILLLPGTICYWQAFFFLAVYPWSIVWEGVVLTYLQKTKTQKPWKTATISVLLDFAIRLPFIY